MTYPQVSDTITVSKPPRFEIIQRGYAAMSLITASLKFIARTANDMLLNSNTQRAKKIAYRETGETMRKANRKGKYINGAELYRENLNKNIAKAKAKHNNRDKFISDL